MSGVGSVRAAASGVVERKVLVPDANLVKSLGARHDLATAVADLIDNGIDAGATRVLVIFETRDGEPVGLSVVDDGRGMDGATADEAMRIGGRREYETGSHGHFGLGLKSASFSHAQVFTVCTTPGGGEYHGRRLIKSEVQRDYSCDVLDPVDVASEVDDHLALIGARTGTVVRWSETDFPTGTGWSGGRWLDESRAKLRMHLGIVYHRLLAAGRLSIEVEVYDDAVGEAGAPELVAPIDPLGFPIAAVTGYPARLAAVLDAHDIALACHIVPPKSSAPNYRLYGRDGADAQGFYIYRHDRLLQVGGWNGVTASDKGRALARVVIDDADAVGRHVRMNPEKSGILFSPALRTAIAEASDGKGLDFQAFLDRAGRVLSDSRRRRHVRRPIAEPRRGMHDNVRRAIRAEAPVREDEGPVDVRWRSMPRERFLDLDREERVIYLNSRYRDMLTGGRNGISDAPLLKTLVFLLTEQHFTGQHWGPRDKDLFALWDTILGAAVQTEQDYRTAERRR